MLCTCVSRARLFPRLKTRFAFFDLMLYLVFFVGGIVALVYAGWDFFATSLAQNERSSIAADGPPIYPFKAIIPAAGLLLLIQGLVEIVRCAVCLRTGEWPSREEDVEEVDVDKLKAMVTSHTNDADSHAQGAR